MIRDHLELNPDDTRALYLGAGVLADLGKTEEAIDWIEQALALEPNKLSVLYNATCVFSKLGLSDRALDLFEKRVE